MGLRLWTAFVLALAAVGTSSCAGAPVQEMSNARQAIKAAREAGAEQVVPQKLAEARLLLQRAEESLQKRAYREARRDAVAAYGKATEALGEAQASNRSEKTG